MAKQRKRSEGFHEPVAEFYDAEYARYRILEEDLPFFMQLLPTRRQSILEIGVGTGRAALPLVQAGHRVLGVDLDADMLEIARRKAAAVGILPADLRLVRADATTLNLREKFDWVCIFFNTMLNFSSKEQLNRLLAGVAAHLKPKGRFYFDIFMPDLVLLSQALDTRPDVDLFFVPHLGQTIQRQTVVRNLPEPQLQEVTFTYRWFDPDGRERVIDRTHRMTWIFPRELESLLRAHGLRIQEIWGNYDGSEPTADSPRIICVAGK